MDTLMVQSEIGSRIFELRGVLMLDRDIAQLYGVETRRLNEQKVGAGDNDNPYIYGAGMRRPKF